TAEMLMYFFNFCLCLINEQLLMPQNHDVGYNDCNNCSGRILEDKVFNKVQHYRCFGNVELVEDFSNDLAQVALIEWIDKRSVLIVFFQAAFTQFSNLYEVFIRCFIFKVSSRSEEHTSELQSRFDLVCRLLLEK